MRQFSTLFQYDILTGIAIDSRGDVIVANRDCDRMERYDNHGNFLQMWGWGVQNGAAELQFCTSGCRAGISGAGNGQFDLPTGIDVLGESVYVSDWDNDRIQVFSRGGLFQRTIAADYSTAGLSVSPAGEIYVALFWGDEVLKLNSGGTQVARWGVSGSGIGEFSHPYGVAVAPSGNVYVADKDNSRIQKFGPALQSFKAELQGRTMPLIAFKE